MRIKKLLFLGLIIGSVVLAGCSRAQEKMPDGKQELDNSIAVEVMDIETQTITRDYSSAGKLYPNAEVNISSNTNGEVESINFDIGDIVKKNDVLFTLDNSDLLNNIDLQKSKLEKSLEDARIAYEDALENYNNMKSLYESGAISKDGFDNAQNSFDMAKLNYDQAKKDLESNLITLNSNYNDTIIKSPLDGIVSERNIEVGEMTTGVDFVIVNLDPIIVKTNVSEDIINKISVGDETRINILSNDYVVNIKTISPVVINISNIYLVEVEVENPNYILKPGMYAEVDFEIEKLENRVLIPKKSILTEGNENYVYIIKDNKPQRIVIEKGITKDGYVEILNGLNKGDQLVVKGQEYINEDSDIKIVSEDE